LGVISPSKTKKYEVESARELLALNVLRLRNELGWSQEALAFEAGLHRTFIAHVERQARNISIDNIERIAAALGVPIAELLGAPRGDS
jgi:transcriptional regulator with XRE-family HTH domain